MSKELIKAAQKVALTAVELALISRLSASEIAQVIDEAEATLYKSLSRNY